MNAGAKILVVDDEPQIARVLRRALEANGFEVRVAPDGETAMDILKAWAPDLLITDLAMPGVDGLALCTRVRKVSAAPIIVLSVKGEEATKVKALDLGADDYVAKPFGMDELLARIRALLRRVGPTDSNELDSQIGDFEIQPHSRKIRVRATELHLTPKEYDLMVYFLSHHSRVLTHRAILRAIWGENSAEQTEYLRVFVGQLRRKIEVDYRSPRYLKTEPWIGYRFDPGAQLY